jgi:hypothetical protein
MFSTKFPRIPVLCISVVALLAILLSGEEALSDKSLSLCRGLNKQEHSQACESCASANLLNGTLDACLCSLAQNLGAFCTLCANTTATSQNLQQGHVQGDPGWLSANVVSCLDDSNNNQLLGKCQMNGSCGQTVALSQCTNMLQEYAEEGAGD